MIKMPRELVCIVMMMLRLTFEEIQISGGNVLELIVFKTNVLVKCLEISEKLFTYARDRETISWEIRIRMF